MKLINLSSKPGTLVGSASRIAGIVLLAVGILAIASGLHRFSGEALAKDANSADRISISMVGP